MIKNLHNLALLRVKNAHFFVIFFSENILKIITSVPGQLILIITYIDSILQPRAPQADIIFSLPSLSGFSIHFLSGRNLQKHSRRRWTAGKDFRHPLRSAEGVRALRRPGAILINQIMHVIYRKNNVCQGQLCTSLKMCLFSGIKNYGLVHSFCLIISSLIIRYIFLLSFWIKFCPRWSPEYKLSVKFSAEIRNH
jgi:hypothetical protein